jgi:hypothetical protein
LFVLKKIIFPFNMQTGIIFSKLNKIKEAK